MTSTEGAPKAKVQRNRAMQRYQPGQEKGTQVCLSDSKHLFTVLTHNNDIFSILQSDCRLCTDKHVIKIMINK